jgi:polyhydroxyalkanoate synthase
LRTALLGLGLLGLVYAASRRAGSGEPALSSGEGRETVGDAVPGAESEPADEGAAEETLPGEDRSTAEIAERAEGDVTEEPAPPGEMAVDEDLVEEMVDEEAEDAPAGEADSGREDEAESDADEGRT